MLIEFDLKDFKSYGNARLKLAPLTVLIGANASGKSNAIEAIRLLSWIAQGNRLGAIRYAVYEGDEALRGTTQTLSRRGQTSFRLGARTDNPDWDRFSITIDRSDDDELHIDDERIVGRTSSVPLYEVVGRSGGSGSDLQVAYNNFARGGVKPRVMCSDQMAIMLQLQSAARFEAGHKSAQGQIPAICRNFQAQLSQTLFLDPQPSLMRGYSFKTETRLSGNGSNLSGVLWGICSEEDRGAEILELIRSLPEQNISAINFIETPRGEVMLSLKESFGASQVDFDATLLSDGTLRVLSIAAALYTAAPGTLVVIEEIDNGVHPSRAEMLLNRISIVAKERGLRVLISSHNPALLDALPDDAVPNVVFCYRNTRSGHSELIRLSDAPDYPELVAQGPLGHLLTAGLIERFVKNHPGQGERKRRSQAWLDSLRAGSGV